MIGWSASARRRAVRTLAIVSALVVATGCVGATTIDEPAARTGSDLTPTSAPIETAADQTSDDATAPPTPTPPPSPAVSTVVPDPTPQPTAVPTATVEPAASPSGETEADTLRAFAPNGRRAPLVGATPSELAAQIANAEAAFADPTSDSATLAEWGHVHQVAIRKLGYEPDWDVDVFTLLPPEIVERTVLHVAARRALVDLHSGYDAADFIPAWEIIEPAPLDELLAHYRAAEEATGIEWSYLAGINLIETGMGRIRGLSSAGAQGPMQFLPTTWDEAGIGEGDINEPGDAIAAAARYLVRRGGPADMPGAIWGYNNSDNYVSAVLAYAELLRADPQAYTAIYHWEIYFSTDQGDVWLPTGFRSDDVIDLDDYLVENPWSEPDPGLR